MGLNSSQNSVLTEAGYLVRAGEHRSFHDAGCVRSRVDIPDYAAGASEGRKGRSRADDG